uniref:Uncharacterized protein n=1 Tax=viral metagenome TaxID=1070528 RepID=A0A6C0BCQ4_9ZZZZ
MEGLILCHPRKVSVENGRLTNHWYGDMVIYDINFSGVNMSTVDIIGDPNILANCFSQKFWSSHLKEYSVLIAPDSGGLWYKFQEDHEEIGFKILLEGILTMMSDNCHVILDKFIYPKFREIALQVLLEDGFLIIQREFKITNGILAVRNKS